MIGGEIKGLDGEFYIINVYGPREVSSRKKLWEDLLEIRNSSEGNFLFLGDFNDVREVEEQKNSSFDYVSAFAFNNFIREAGLNDYKMGGAKFTYISDAGSKCSKLDRFLVCDRVMALWPNAKVLALPRQKSDHRPIILLTQFENYRPIPFKFFNSWLDDLELGPIVKAVFSLMDEFATKAVTAAERINKLKHLIK